MIYLLSIIVLLLSYNLFKSAAGSMALNKLNMISIVFYFYFFLTSYVGTVFIANGFGDNPVLSLVSYENRIKVWLVVSYAMIMTPLGMLLAKALFQISNVGVIYNDYILAPVQTVISCKDSYIRFFLYLLTGICFLSAVYVVVNVGGIPQKQFFDLKSQANVLVMRNEINRGFSGIYAIKSVFFEQLTPLLSFISYGYYSMTKSFKDRLWFYSLFFLSVFVVTFTLSKSPLVKYFILFMILRIYMKGAIKWKYFLMFSIFAFLSIVLMFFAVSKDANSSFVFQYLFERIFFDQVSGTFLMFEIFPSQFEFLGVSSLSKPLSTFLTGEYNEPATRIAMGYAFPSATSEGLMNLLSTLFVGEAWANFGWLGVLLAPVYVGLVIGGAYYFILHSKKTPLSLSLLAFFSFGISISSQFNQYLYNSTVFILLFIFLLSFLCAKCLRVLKK